VILSKSPLAPFSQSSGLTVRRIVTYSTEIVGDGLGVQIIGGRDIVVISQIIGGRDIVVSSQIIGGRDIVVSSPEYGLSVTYRKASRHALR
jgi:hypothetical protein